MSEDPLDALETAAAAYEERRSAVEAVGEDDLRTVADAVERATGLLDRYADTATGTGDYRSYVEFRKTFVEHAEELPEELPEREAFETAAEAVDRRRLSEDDFERARSALDPAVDLAARLDDRESARARLRDARSAARRRIDEIDERVAELERVRELGAADLDAPVERLRDPVAAYDEAVAAAFDELLHEASARSVIAFLDATEQYPLVPFASPPDDLRAYLLDGEAATETIPTLLQYADYSRSKLGHYVDDPAELGRRVATNRTYLERLDADPLAIGWPPPPAETLRWRCRELIPVVDRFAPEDVVADLRTVRRRTRDPERYERLRRSAVARADLDEAERERLASGAVDRELDERRAERRDLERALDDRPAP